MMSEEDYQFYLNEYSDCRAKNDYLGMGKAWGYIREYESHK